MRPLLCLMLSVLLVPATAEALDKPKLVALQFTSDSTTTHVELDFSAPVGVRATVLGHQANIDLPPVIWGEGVAQRGRGEGWIKAYRINHLKDGLRIVLNSDITMKLVSDGPIPIGDHIAIDLVRSDDLPQYSTQILQTGPAIYGSPVIETVSPYGVAPVVTQPPAASHHRDCASGLVPDGRVGSNGNSSPAYRFSDDCQ